MKVEIEIEDKYVNAVVAQLAITDDYDEETIEKVKEKCLSETIKIDPEDFGEVALQFKLGLAMMAIGVVGLEIEKDKENEH
jgi:hypothetical protein